MKFEVEFDGYETASSNEDITDIFHTGTGDNDSLWPLSHINIMEAYSDADLPDIPEIPDSEDPFVHTELVLKFHHAIHPEALRWFIQRVLAKKSKGGAELLLRREPYMGMKREGLVAHVTALGWRQLEVAEMLEIKKMDYAREVPIPREFKIRELGRFLKEDMQTHELLTPAEKQMVVMHELKHFHSRPGETHVPGYKHMKLTPGQSILHVFTTHNLITSYFALHQEDELTKLEHKWFWEFFSKQPYEDIRAYFGDTVCLYFNFLAYYTAWLIVPAILGPIVYLLPEYLFHRIVIGFCLLNTLFVTVFLICWQRHCSGVTFKWGTLRSLGNTWEDPRANYTGVLGLDPVTGKYQMEYPYYKTALKTYIGSLSVILVCFALALWMLWIYLDIEEKVNGQVAEYKRSQSSGEDIGLFWLKVYPLLPSAVYALVIYVATKTYRRLAIYLTEWENHRTETQFEKHLVLKMVVFEVANSFSSLFYTAFVTKNIILLKSRLSMMVGVVQMAMTLEAAFVPVMFRSGKAKMHEFLDRNKLNLLRVDKWGNFVSDSSHVFNTKQQPNAKPYPGIEEFDLEVLSSDDPRVEMSKVEGKMDPYDYEADFEDYLQLLQQFGYIFLFSAVFPPAALLAFLCNVGLLWGTLYKLREVYQRPMAKRASNIGAWQAAFGFMGVIAAMTNCALLCTNEHLRQIAPSFSDVEWIFLFVIIEHAILCLQYFCKKVMPKVPYRIKLALVAYEYRSREALRREQALKTRRRMTRIFQPINEELYDKPQHHGRKSHSEDSESEDYKKLEKGWGNANHKQKSPAKGEQAGQNVHHEPPQNKRKSANAEHESHNRKERKSQ